MPCTHDFCLILPPSPWPSSLSQRLLTYYTAPASLNPFPILPPESPQDRRLPPRNTSTHACKRWLGICSKYYQIIITCEGGYLGGASHPPTRKKPSEDQTLASNCTPPPVIFIRGSCSGVLDAWRSGSLEGKVQSIIFVPAVRHGVDMFFDWNSSSAARHGVVGACWRLNVRAQTPFNCQAAPPLIKERRPY